jgi:hypothetical protein
MAEIEMSEISYTTDNLEAGGQEMEPHSEQAPADASNTTCVIVGTVVDSADVVTSSVPTSNQNYVIEGFADTSVAIEHVGDVPVKFELPDNVCVGSINGAQFAMFEGNPEATVATCIAQSAHPNYSLETFTDSEVKVEPVDHNGAVPIFKDHDVGSTVFSGKVEVVEDTAHAVSNGRFEAIPVTAISSIAAHFGVVDASGGTASQFAVIHTEPSTISDEQFEAMDPGVIQNPESIVVVNPGANSGSDRQFDVVENPGQVANNDGEFQVVTSTAGEGQLAGMESAGRQLIPAEQFAGAVTDAGTAPASDDQFQVVSGTVCDEQVESMENTANALTEEQITTLSTPEGLINVVQSLGDVQSVGDGQFTLVTPDGLLSVVSPESEQSVSTDGPINVTTENGIQYAILSTPEGLVKVALNAPEGIAAGVLVADENGQLVLQNVTGDLDTGSENAVVQLPVQYADQHDQAVLQANGLVVEETTTTTCSEALPGSNVYAEAVSSGSNTDAASSMVQAQAVQEQPQIEPECFEIYTVEVC